MAGYQQRVVDDELDELHGSLAAIAIEGAKAVGKTFTASRRAQTTYRLDDEEVRSVVEADPSRLLTGERPILIDEWQRLPSSWDIVRRAVDDGAAAGSFLLTGSATPAAGATAHSGAGRIVTLRMRPMTLAERGVATPTVSLHDLLAGTRPPIAGDSPIGLERYVDEILRSGLPGLRDLPDRARRAQLDGYLDRITERDLPELGINVRNPAALRRWLAAYGAASSTTASYETIRDAATSSDGATLSRQATVPYRDALTRLWIVDPVPAWIPSRNHLRRLSQAPKHQLVDPALAARLLGVNAGALLEGKDGGRGSAPRDGTLLGALFESLVTLTVRVAAQAAEARVAHLRTNTGEHEVDLIVERDDGRVVALEVKLSTTVTDRDVRHLRWLRDTIGDELLDAIVVTTGQHAYRRPDGIAVVPAALLGA